MSAVLSARQVCQRLREAALGVLAFNILEVPDAPGLIAVDIEGWRLLLDVEGGRLHHCEFARSGDGQEGALDSWQRYGTDPVSLLSTWELAQIEQMLMATVQPCRKSSM
ncbi:MULTISPECIES: DUF7693 family protein [Pseudomonas]|jgi:hypothetical protein|uniref:DUF7693 family protein n=1 Tax=Pseudomonas TaxID=286 RepID=UPI00054B7474|nr:MULTISPECIES: hypothetical protein [Pseudomonas]KII29064.1 hypothetical protein RY26_28100 [Pseudomonas fluorescens]